MEVLEVMVMAVMLLMVSRVETMSRPSPEQCYYQPYYKQLTCSCNNDNKETTSTSTYLGLKMIHYVKTLGQEVRALISHSVSLRVSFIEKNILRIRFRERQTFPTPLFLFAHSPSFLLNPKIENLGSQCYLKR